MNTFYQNQAYNALKWGLEEYDKRRGWRGEIDNIDKLSEFKNYDYEGKYPEEWTEYDQELQEVQNRQAYQDEVGQPMAKALSTTDKFIDAAQKGAKDIYEKSKTGTLGDPNIRQNIPFLNNELDI